MILLEVTDGASFHDFTALVINVRANIRNPVANPVLIIRNRFIVGVAICDSNTDLKSESKN